MTEQRDTPEGEVDAAQKFTVAELLSRPLDTAKFVVAIIPHTWTLIEGSLTQNVSRVVSAVEGTANALELLRGVNSDKVEAMQSRLREAIAMHGPNTES
ncbi:MAG: hypothetical protein WCT01_00285 [Candidatus Shapirobacteria bacterium]